MLDKGRKNPTSLQADVEPGRGHGSAKGCPRGDQQGRLKDRSDLSVTVEENQLVIRGKQTDAADKTFLHRGIAARQFQRSFVLAEGIEVTGATLENGLLTVELYRPKAESLIRTIEIKSGMSAVGAAGKGGL